MEPPVDERNMRFKCINQYRDIIGPAKTFNGVTLCLPFQLPGILTLNSNLNRRFVSRFFLEKKTVLQSQHPNDGSLITVTITLKWLKRMGDRDCIQLYNVLFNRIMDTLKMVHMSKNCYDPTAGHMIPQHKLEGVIFYDLDPMLPSPPQ